MAAFEEFRILTPNAMCGYGYRKDHFWYGIEKYKPSAIIVDCGSTDGGPYKLGLNRMTCGRGSYIRDLEPMLDAAYHKKIKLLIGSVGGDGSNLHVQEMLRIVTEIAKSKGYSFKIATIDAGIDRDLICSRIRDQKVGPCGPVPPLTEEDVHSAVDVVAQMGCEPYMKALESDPDIILGGRSYDPAPFAALCLAKGCLPGVAWHVGKIMECGGMCAVPKGRSMIATMRRDSFDLTPLAAEERCTPLSVAAHTLYEKTRPDRLPGPGGILNLDTAKYEQITEKTTRISGAEFIPSPVYQVKLEGVTKLGYRTIFIGGIRDPILISQIDDFLERVRTYTQGLFPELDQSEHCRLIYHIYGRNAVMGPLEPNPQAGHEIGILGEVVAPTQELSYTIANNYRASILHFAYPDQIATTGNFASPLSPHENEAGPVFKFSLYHLVDLKPGEELSLFPVTLHEIDSEGPAQALQAIDPKDYSAVENGSLAPVVRKQVPVGACKMPDIARIIRSKNSGPFELTLDIMFDSEEPYKRVKAANLLTNATIQELYNVKEDEILTNMYFDPAFAWKCTIKRPWAQGSVGERDTLGTQQHAPLLGIDVPPASVASSNGHMNGVNGRLQGAMVDRSAQKTADSVQEIWQYLDLPHEALSSLHLPNADELGLPSSCKVGHVAQLSIGLSALSAAAIGAKRNDLHTIPQVTVPLHHACAEFRSERLYTLNGEPAKDPRGNVVGGLHKTSDGYVRIHDAFPHHRQGALKLLGLSPETTSREAVQEKVQAWTAVDLECEATANDIVIGALRNFKQWDALPQSKAIPNMPILLKRIGTGKPDSDERLRAQSDRCLAGLRVVELSRVIAAPVAGKTLAAHGADVIWVTSPSLPSLPDVDIDVSRGKRSVQLDIRDTKDKNKLLELIRTADVFLQSYRPGALETLGLGMKDLLSLNPNLIIANLSAYGNGPWAKRRGFDSIVQTVSGINVSEAEHAGQGESVRVLPCQALDHASGYFLAAGIMAAAYKRLVDGGAYQVDVSLAGTMKYLRSLGQYEGAAGFHCNDDEDVSSYIETRESGFGELSAVRHSATVEGFEVGWDVMPMPLGSDRPVWNESQHQGI